MTGPSWRRLRTALGVAVLGAVLWRTGTGPVVLGLRSLDAATLLVGAAIAVPTTVACAWRWHLVAGGLGVAVDVGAAVACCYRAQLLNATLPGGVLGDVHRGLRHGTAVGHTGRAVRSVLWERTAGQCVLALVAVLVLLILPSPVRGALPVALLLLVAVGSLAGVLVVRLLRTAAPGSATGRTVRACRDDVRRGLLARSCWPGVLVASTVAAAGHAATYLLAARAVGVTAPTLTLLPLVLLVLLAAGLPTNVAGWGPREGMAAWTFAAAGLGAGPGLATAVAYGAIVLVACLPGAAVLALGARPGRPAAAPAAVPGRAATGSGGPAHG